MTSGWTLPRLCLALALAAAPLPLFAQMLPVGGSGFLFQPPRVSLTFRGGYDRALARSDLFDFTTSTLTLDRGDFASTNLSLDLGVRVSPRLELVAGIGTADRSPSSEFRKFVDNNDQPIEQTTRLRRTPVSLGMRYALTPRGETLSRLAWIPSGFVPWVGAGVGAMSYEFSQQGDFVDAKTLNVFTDRLGTSGWAPMAYGAAGFDVKVSRRVFLTTDLRYTHARGRAGSAFNAYDWIDLSGAAVTAGLSFRP